MPNENLFSDIPALDDEAGLNAFLDAQTQTPVENVEVPPLQQVQNNPAQPVVNQGVATPQPQTTEVPQYTSEQIQQIIRENQAFRAQQAQRVTQSQVAPMIPQKYSTNNSYTPQQLGAIKTLLDRGYSLEAIMNAVARSNANPNNIAQNQALRRIEAIEQQMQLQQYKAEETAFVNKMTTFGDKFGLSENDLVVFGNQAMAKGINLTQVDDVEMVFKALYPQQYAIRTQRMQNTPTSQIYGGVSMTEAPRAASSKVEDAYVDAFLKKTMPNQYEMFKK